MQISYLFSGGLITNYFCTSRCAHCLSISVNNPGKELDSETYPFINTLYHKGIKDLFEYVKSEFHYRPGENYLNKCHICNDIRSFLIHQHKLSTAELQPEAYYHHL